MPTGDVPAVGAQAAGEAVTGHESLTKALGLRETEPVALCAEDHRREAETMVYIFSYPEYPPTKAANE